LKNNNEGGDMKQSGKFFPGWPAEDGDTDKIETSGQYVKLTLVDGHPDRQRGYNPYDTVVHARDTRPKDVWRHKPKRA
jgi:hypothetical protein